MTNRKDKPIGFRFVSAVAACLFIGSVVYVLVVGINLYVGAALAAAVPLCSLGRLVLRALLRMAPPYLRKRRSAPNAA